MPIFEHLLLPLALHHQFRNNREKEFALKFPCNAEVYQSLQALSLWLHAMISPKCSPKSFEMGLLQYVGWVSDSVTQHIEAANVGLRYR